jgi:hypothetical protein
MVETTPSISAELEHNRRNNSKQLETLDGEKCRESGSGGGWTYLPLA